MDIETCVQKEGSRKGRRLRSTGATADRPGSAMPAEEFTVTPRLLFTGLLKSIMGQGRTGQGRAGQGTQAALLQDPRRQMPPVTSGIRKSGQVVREQ